VHLNAQGKIQAQKTADWLADKKICAIVSSPITRAMETAQPLADLTGLPIITNDLLMEVDYGDWTGWRFEDLKEKPAWQEVLQKPLAMQFPNGENIAQIEQRMRTFIRYLVETYSEKDVVVCYSHADLLCIMIALCVELPLLHYRNLTISPAAVSALSYGQQKWKIHFLNQTMDEKFEFSEG
jgi:probable phosphoglycerate mutase